MGDSCPLGWQFVLIVFCLFVMFVCFKFGFKSGICLLIAPVPGHCFSITFFTVYRHGGNLGHVTIIISINDHFIVSESSHICSLVISIEPRRLIGELIVSPCSGIRPQFQTSSKPLGQSNFVWSTGGTNVCSRHLGHIIKGGRHAHIWLNPSKIFSGTSQKISTKLGM